MQMHVATQATIDPVATSAPKPYAWIVFALTAGLMLSDFMSRQVLSAVFPSLKAAWHLSDAQLGSFNSIVALMVGVLTFPLSVLADRWGRVKSIVLMASLWSLATLGCAVSVNYGQMLLARALIGLGEASYGAVGPALIMSIFPAHLRSTLTAGFMAGAAFGSVIGMALGGMIAATFGWRWSFGGMAGFGLMLVILYRLVITEKRLAHHQAPHHHARSAGLHKHTNFRELFAMLFRAKSAQSAYLGSGLQIFVGGALYAWLPSYLNRYYAMSTSRAATLAAGFVMISGVGMIVCGIVTDHISKAVRVRKWTTSIVFCLFSFVALIIAFRLPVGPSQLALIAIGMFLANGTNGPSGAMVANVTPSIIHASTFATLTLANSLIGMAPGPLVTGLIADRVGLLSALQFIPLASLLAAVAFARGRRFYVRDVATLNESRDSIDPYPA